MSPDEIKAAALAITDGVFFNLPMDVYREVDRLSTTGIQRILISPATFWRDSWLNPNPPVLTPEQRRNREIAKLLGSAYHCARLEPDQFTVRYVRGLAEDDMPEGSLITGKDMGAKLKDMGLPVSGSVAEQAERLAAGGFDRSKIWQLALQDWQATVEGRTPLKAATWDEILVDMERIRAVPEVTEHLTGGEAEVSVFWTCPDSGIPMKARFDYLKAAGWTDFKSYANSNGKDVEQAILDAFTYNRYYIQAAVYLEAAEAIRSGLVDIMGDYTEDQLRLLTEVARQPDELACWYVFQEKDGVPNLFAYEVELFDVPVNAKVGHPITDDQERHAAVERGQRRKSQFHIKARVQIRRAKELFMSYSDTFPAGEPWRPIKPVGRISDVMFSPYWLEDA